jgi:hypothetical protein
VSFKSDGYVCGSTVCNVYAGSLLDSNYNWRWWRGAFFSRYDLFRGSRNQLISANAHLTQRTTRSSVTTATVGTVATRAKQSTSPQLDRAAFRCVHYESCLNIFLK